MVNEKEDWGHFCGFLWQFILVDDAYNFSKFHKKHIEG